MGQLRRSAIEPPHHAGIQLDPDDRARRVSNAMGFRSLRALRSTKARANYAHQIGRSDDRPRPALDETSAIGPLRSFEINSLGLIENAKRPSFQPSAASELRYNRWRPRKKLHCCRPVARRSIRYKRPLLATNAQVRRNQVIATGWNLALVGRCESELLRALQARLVRIMAC